MGIESRSKKENSSMDFRLWESTWREGVTKDVKMSCDKRQGISSIIDPIL